MDEVIINNEKDAFDLLQKALNQELSQKPFSIKFDKWPILEIKLEGEGYDSTITPDLAGALVEVQHALNRAYARTVHRTSNARSLTDDERRKLQFKAKVQKGSSLIKIDLGPFAEKLVTSGVDKMTPELLTICVLGTVISAAGVIAYKTFLKSRSEDKAISESERAKIALSQEETMVCPGVNGHKVKH